MTLSAITVRQPYSGLIAAGLKLVENRAARTSIRGLVAIHSAKAVDFPELHKQIAAGVVAPFTVLGAVLAVADLTGCHEADQDSPATCCGEYGMRTYSNRPAIHLTLANVRQLRHPVECRGQLGFWTVPADVESAVRRQISPIAEEAQNA